MVKRALCVGINDYPLEDSDLNGCVNDARAWAALLVDHFDFPRTDVKLVTDADATKAKLVVAIKALLSGAKSGDTLVFTNSSHGSYIADKSGDEPNKFDEIICPYDIGDNALTDDELRQLFCALPTGVGLTVISDSCFSGTLTRVPLGANLPTPLRPPDDRRIRFLNPGLLGRNVVSNPFKAQRKSRALVREQYPESRMKEVLLSGCTDSEYSYDALIDGVYHGAMTYHAIKAIRAANYRLTYNQLSSQLQPLLDASGYSAQHPQLEGSNQGKRRQLFA
jgi:hypothetical protein